MVLGPIPVPRKCHILSWTLLILMLVQNFLYCHGTATLKIKFMSYTNPNGRDWYNEQCDLVFHTACDHLFDICIDKANGNSNIGSCKYLLKSSGEFRNQDRIQFQGDMNGVANPITVKMNKWENILLKVRVRDDDSHSSHDLVDLHYLQYVATPGFNNIENTPVDRVILGQRTSTHKTSLLVQFSVKCNSYYYGSDCTKYCKYSNNNNGHYRCSSNGDKECLPGWEDAANNCLVRSDDCLGHTCLNGATCVDGVRSYTCNCAPGYTGEKCQVDIDECAPTPCQNGGTCMDAVNSYNCQCPPEFPRSLSSVCSLHICSHDDPCQNGGTCFGEGMCMCPPNYTGTRCEMHFCQSNCIVCQNGGTCTGSECICPPGVLGQKCEVDLCDHMTCFNGGQCTNGECQCLEGYTGLYCHEMKDNCASHPCLNEGYCINNIKNFTCVCVDGYTGDLCDTEKPKPTTEKPIKDNNDVLKETLPNVFSEKELLQSNQETAAVVESSSSPPVLYTIMIVCLVFLVLIILVLVLILCKDRINRKRKQILANRDREATMNNFDNPVYTVDQILAQGRLNTYDDARYGQPITDNDTNAARYAEAIATGGATGMAKNAEALYDYPTGGRDPIPVGRGPVDPLYDQPRSLMELQQPPPYSPPEDPHYAIPTGGAVSMRELKARLEDEPHYEDVQSLKNSLPKD